MKFVIPLTPVGQMRARSCVRGNHAATYKAKAQLERENTLAALLVPHRPAVPLDGPLTLRVVAWMPIPASKPKAWKADAVAAKIRPTCKPDLDNLIKHIKDVLTTMRFWVDDRLVVGISAAKMYSYQPRWEIEIEPWRYG